MSLESRIAALAAAIGADIKALQAGGGGAVPTIKGVAACAVGRTEIYVITNYDSATAYTLSAIAGTVSRDGELIIYNAPATTGAGGFVVNGRSFAVAIIEPPILGIVLVATGGGSGTWQRVDENFAALDTSPSTFDSHPTYAGIASQIVDGQAMVKVPKYWIKAGFVPNGPYVGKRYWMISDQPAPGFEVHPAFMDAGSEIAQFWAGKYQGTNDGGTKLGSVAGVTPLVSIDLPTMQARATARNTGGVTGFALWDYYKLAAIQTLALIEMGGANSQALIGQGHVGGGAALAVDHAIVAQATWRGIVGLWGNAYQLIDGLRTNASGRYEIWDKIGNKTWVDTGVTAPATGVPVTFATASGANFDLGLLMLPATSSTVPSNGTTGDAFFSAASSFAYHGGYWSDGANAGLFWLAVNSTGLAHNALGGRLAKV